MKIAARLSAAVLAGALLAGCGGSPQTASAPEDERPTLVVSIYALEYLASEIAGEDAEVLNVVPPGAEPHDFELTPRDVLAMDAAEVVVTVSGFQPAVDAAAEEISQAQDLAPVLELRTRSGALDPHFWLDPKRMITSAGALTEALVAADPAQEAAYRERHEQVESTLTQLNEAFREGLAQCTYDSFVTGHLAFGYLAEAYGLNEISVAGIDPDTEPSPAALSATREEIRSLGLPIVFAEPGETKIAEVLAAELGIDSGVLNPLEAVAPEQDYLTVMYENLDALRGGLQCH